MHRDMELIRLILLRQEGDEDARSAIEQVKVDQGEAGQRLLAHHAAILIEAGFIIGTVSSDSHGVPRASALIRLTWEGHNFLDAIRDKAVWNTTKEKVLKPGASWTISLLLEVAKLEIRKHLGI